MDKFDLLLRSSFKEELITAIHTSPIVYVRSFDFSLVEQALLKLTNITPHNPLGFCEENIAICDMLHKQLISLQNHTPLDEQTDDISLDIMMKKIKARRQKPYSDKMLFIINNVHHNWDNNIFTDYIHQIADKYVRGEYEKTMCVLLVDDYPVTTIPTEIEKFTTVIDIPHPRLDDIIEMVRNLDVSKREQNPNSLREDLSRTLLGLNYYEIESILKTIKYKNLYITKDSLAIALSAKKEIVKKSGLIEVCDSDVNINDIGGLEILVDEIKKKSTIYRHLREVKSKQFNLPFPKGILIIGMPGCGKSLIAKAISNKFQTSLLRLDVNKLMGKYVGESEENLRKALLLAETAQPCVLWIDEIEKAFAGANGKEGSDMLVQRLMGQFLTWMQERKSAVYVVATANDAMKPEFMRKGRFDEVFFVDFPSKAETQQILEVKLNTYSKKESIFDLSDVKNNINIISEKLSKADKLIGKMNFHISFSGSEIECLVNNVIEDATVDYLKRKEAGEKINSSEKIKITKENFISKISVMSESIMASQKSASEDQLTSIDKIRNMQITFNFKKASL